MKCVLFFALAAAVVQEVTPVQKVAGVEMQRAGISPSSRHEVAAVFAGVCSFPKCYSAMLGVSAFVFLVIVVFVALLAIGLGTIRVSSFTSRSSGFDAKP